jgi:hypothetical protein
MPQRCAYGRAQREHDKASKVRRGHGEEEGVDAVLPAE